MNALAKTWEATERLLRAAANQLPTKLALENGSAKLPSGQLTGSPHEFEEFLGHNELELAWDTLAEIGRRDHAGLEFWILLARAAERMELTDKADQASREAACRVPAIVR